MNELNEIKRILKNHEKRISKLEKIINKFVESNKRGIKIKYENIIEKFKKLDLSNYPYIYKLKGLPLFLLIIKIAYEEFNIDGLSPPEISRICKEKFRISTGVDRTYISHTLSRAKKYVDRIPNPRGRGYVYRIMKEGEDFLKKEIEKVNKNER